jgi:hypothetical protein
MTVLTRRGTVGFVEVGRDMAWRGSPGRAGQVLARRGEARFGEAVRVEHGLSRRGKVGRGRARRGDAVLDGRGAVWQGTVWLGASRQGSRGSPGTVGQCWACRVLLPPVGAGRGMARQSTRGVALRGGGNAWHGPARRGGMWQGGHGMASFGEVRQG